MNLIFAFVCILSLGFNSNLPNG